MRPASHLLWSAAVAGVAFALALTYASGCTADLKTGVGNVNQALALERYSLGAALVALLASVAACAKRAPVPASTLWVAGALGAFLLGTLLFFVAQIQVQIWAIQSCRPG